MAIRIVPGVAVPRPGNQPAPRLVPPHLRLPSRAVSGHGGPMDSKDFPYLVAPYLADSRSEVHTSELHSIMRISFDVFCLIKNMFQLFLLFLFILTLSFFLFFFFFSF